MDRSEFIRKNLRTIPDFPKQGILFRDSTTLLLHPDGLKVTIEALTEQWQDTKVEKVVAIDARGFVYGAALAQQWSCGLALARKKGKLPGDVIEASYELEYGTDVLEIDTITINKGEKCLVVDDLIATGGTAQAACELVSRIGGQVVGCAFVIELPDLKGRELLSKYDVRSLVTFEGH